jgi:membrane peptidoglycan carboxypeptidase
MSGINFILTPRLTKNDKPGIFFRIFEQLLLIIRPLTKGILTGLFIFSSSIAISISIFYWVYSAVKPDIAKITDKPLPESTKIYDRTGDLLYEIHNGGKRTNLPLSRISKNIQNATLAVEDKNFYSHFGFVPHSLLRALAINYANDKTLQGGSTITQQVVKNLVLTPQKTGLRKIVELVWAIELERKLTKDQILELYLNSIPYGRNSIGIESASKTYFGKSASDLSVAESAYLAALPQAPSYYNPSGPNQSELEDRKNYILKLMLSQGKINELIYQSSLKEDVAFLEAKPPFKAPHFVTWIQDYLENNYTDELLKIGGLNVYTTLDPKIQSMAENTLKDMMKDYPKKFHASNGATVITNTKNGEILAMVGSRDFNGVSEPAGCKSGKSCWFEPQTNAATALLQPGSSFKPYVYTTAFSPEFGYSPSSIVDDIAKDFGRETGGSYIPQNYNLRQYGKISMRKALAGSLNISTVYTATLVGTPAITTTARKLGITAPLKNCGLSMALGSCEISLVEHTNGLGTIANMGVFNPASGILAIYKNNGEVVTSNQPQNIQVIEKQSAYETISILTDNKSREFIFGKDTPLEFKDRAVMAKTGTTQNWKDGWTVGATPSFAVGVWIGNSDGSLMKPNSDGIYVAAPIWRSLMEQLTKDSPPENFTIPEGIKILAINQRTGKPLTKNIPPNGPTEIFASFSNAITGKNVAGLTVKKQEKPKEDVIDPNILALEPFSTNVLDSIPAKLQAINIPNQNFDYLELFIDGASVQTISKKPYIFEVPKFLQNGPHAVSIYLHISEPETITPHIGKTK